MKILFISDTHGLHQQLTHLPPADMIIHAGDVSGRGQVAEVQHFLDWYAALPYQHKILIAGNHDFLFEKQPALIQEMMPSNIHYLENESLVIEGIKLWGSPVSPWFFDWAFNVHRGAPIRKYWKQIPSDTDILITHGPPHGILDEVHGGELVGCEELIKVVNQIKPKVHVFGHIHEAYGLQEKNGTTFINASVLNRHYYLTNEAVLLEV